MEKRQGLIHYYWGDGKGKTTAAMGLALRALGSGLRVTIVQFLKNGTSCELNLFKTLPGVNVFAVPDLSRFSFAMTPEEKAACAKVQEENMRLAKALIAEGSCDVLILDEVETALNSNTLDRGDFLAFLDGKKPETEIVMTGHKPEADLIARADYVTRMQKEKHPYDRGVTAREGIER